jgi:hypothetical protein
MSGPVIRMDVDTVTPTNDDANGNIYGAVVRRQMLERHVRK